MTIRVNGRSVPDVAEEYELQRLIRFYSDHLSEEQLAKQMDVLKARAREQAIGAALLMEQARKLDIQVPERDVDERVETMIENAGGRAEFGQILESQNLTEAGLRENIREGRRLDLLVDRVSSDVGEPREEELKAHYEKHLEEYRSLERVKAEHILIKPDSEDVEDKEVARSKLLEIKQRIADGADFGDEAEMHSECPSGENSRGSLGWLERGTMLPQIEEALFSLEVGQVGEIIETPLGFHVMRKSDAEGSRQAPYGEVRDKVHEFLRHTRRGEAIAAYVEELKSKSTIEED